MEGDVLHSGSSYTDDDEKNLGILLEAFGSAVSLEDIASVYCEKGRNLHSTAEMLCAMEGGRARTSSSKPQDDGENTSSASPVCLPNNKSDNAHIINLKQEKGSATMGTVSSVIGKDYFKHRPQTTGLKEKSKPVKLHSEKFPVSEIWEEKNASASHAESMDKDVQEFIFKMLGNGFQLEMSVIQDVVGKCGYDMPKSMDKLLDLSAATLGKCDDVIGLSAGVKPAAGRLKTDVDNGKISAQTETEKRSVEREVLNALFCTPDRNEEKQFNSSIRPVRELPHGRVVSKPLEDTVIEDFTFITRQPVDEKNGKKEIIYEELRKAVFEHWVIMKECYKAAVEAHAKKDYENAQKLMEQGDYFMRKAREADEESAQILTEDSDEEEISLNLHYLEPKEALRQMKLNLASFSGLPSIRCLKVVVGTNGEDAKDGGRKRLITKLLEKEEIQWTEEGNGWTIAIHVNKIDPRKLSFASK